MTDIFLKQSPSRGRCKHMDRSTKVYTVHPRARTSAYAILMSLRVSPRRIIVLGECLLDPQSLFVSLILRSSSGSVCVGAKTFHEQRPEKELEGRRSALSDLLCLSRRAEKSSDVRVVYPFFFREQGVEGDHQLSCPKGQRRERRPSRALQVSIGPKSLEHIYVTQSE